MTHRAVIERNTATGTNAWNQPAAPTFDTSNTVSCRAWSKIRKEIRGDDKEVIVEDIRAVFPPDVNLKAGDRVTINDRRGNRVFDGPLAVGAVTRRGANKRHLEAVLTRHK